MADEGKKIVCKEESERMKGRERERERERGGEKERNDGVKMATAVNYISERNIKADLFHSIWTITFVMRQ